MGRAPQKAWRFLARWRRKGQWLRGGHAVQGMAYAGAALSLGWVAVWASELMFWITPPPGNDAAGLVLAWGLYSLAAAAALSALVWSGLGGWRAAFLGGATLGICVEGAAVATMYDAFPVQLVWTPLAWHGLLSGLAVVGGGLALARGPVALQLAAGVALGVFGAVWGLYWPLEREAPAGLPLMLAYLGATGAGAVAALAALSRLPPLRRGWWLWIAPAGFAVLWALGSLAAPAPERLAGPLMAALSVWAMRRLGRGGEGPRFGPALALGRCLLWLPAPVLMAVLAVAGWGTFGGQPSNIPVALASGAAGLGLWLWLLVRALSPPSAAPPRG